jgi:hypothetical protein
VVTFFRVCLRGNVEKVLDKLAGLGATLDDVDVLVGACHVVRLLAMLLDAVLAHILRKQGKILLQLFLAILVKFSAKKIGVFLKNQCYDNFFSIKLFYNDISSSAHGAFEYSARTGVDYSKPFRPKFTDKNV